jgi:hypothetical protein
MGTLGLRCLQNPSWRKSLEQKDIRVRVGDWDAMSNVGEWEFPLLQEYYPHAKFVCTYRKSEDEWALSVKRMIEKRPWHPTVAKIYGILITQQLLANAIPVISRIKLVHKYHMAAVRQWAAETSTNVLFHEVGDGWGPLCKYLGLPADGVLPGAPYPHENKWIE